MSALTFLNSLLVNMDQASMNEEPRNVVLCKECLDVLESKHRHDFVQCKCPNGTFVDGGTSYQRIGGRDLAKIEIIESPTTPAARLADETTSE